MSIDRSQAAIYLTLALTLFNFIGTSAARVVLTLYALDLGAPASAVGVLGGLLFLFALLLSWPIGAAADRSGGRALLLLGSLLGVVSLVLPFFFRALPAFYLSAALNGLGLAFVHVTLQYLIGVLSKPEERARNFSNFSLAGAATNFLGPLLAGFSIDAFGHAWACLIAATQPAIAAALLLVWARLYPPGGSAAPRAAGPARPLIDRGVARMLVISGMVQLGYDLFQFYLPIYAHSIGLSASAIGSILATMAVAAFVVRMFLAYLVRRLPGRSLLVVVFAMGALGFALVPFSANAIVLALIAFLFGLGMGIGIPLTVILMFANSAEGRSGQTLGLRLTANNLTRVAGPIVFGAVGSAFGLSAVFWIVALILAAGGALSRGVRDATR
ncbi:MAG: MFS transporter [Burkholderiales bacterium]|nr:MFS transporter [Burkholderiales bacterium]